MALKKDFIIEGNLVFRSNSGEEFIIGSDVKVIQGAYIRVTGLAGTKSSVMIYVNIANDSESITRTYQFVPTMTTDNFMTQSYVYLKTLPEFFNAEDC